MGILREKGATGSPIAGASLRHLRDAQTLANTDTEGSFHLNTILPDTLVFSLMGFRPETLIVKEAGYYQVRLDTQNITLSEVQIGARQTATTISTLSTMQSEVLSQMELTKAACCNLAESFETSGSVDMAYKDGITGIRDIQVLGLAGIYTQMLSENQNLSTGISRTWGLYFTPGPWVESIQVNKGTGSVANGYEGLTGQINVELVKPDTGKVSLFLNGYANTLSRLEGNLILKNRLAKRAGSALLLHASGLPLQVDFNRDNFTDLPLYRQFNGLWRGGYSSPKGFFIQWGAQGVSDRRHGGRMRYNLDRDRLSDSVYVYQQDQIRAQAWLKTGWLSPTRPYRSVGVQLGAVYYAQYSTWGLRRYEGSQQQLALNVIYGDIIGTTMHKYKVGLSMLQDATREQVDSLGYRRLELVPGAFFEYTYQLMQKLTVVAGVRFDYHNLYGFWWTPRLHIRYRPIKDVVLRISGGSARRVPNPIAENTAALNSNRFWQIDGSLKPEYAWNVGTSLQYSFKLAGREGTITADYYFNYFLNQVTADYDASSQRLTFYNLRGPSYAHAAQLMVLWEALKHFDIKIAYKYYDVRQHTAGELRQKPLLNQHRALVNLAYNIKGWRFDYTLQIYGAARLPITTASPAEYRRGRYSPTYALMNAQITYAWRAWEWYIGVENLTNYMQPNPIVATDKPFGGYFDASMIWGPVMGSIGYLGFRYRWQKGYKI
jgi:outer membrane receptor for ferrienterochelin and colicins